jgi:hypothetical protein
MSGAAYKEFNITVYANQNSGDGLWVSDIRILSLVGKTQTLDDVGFNTRDEAEEHGMRMAKEWVDRQYRRFEY